MVKKTYNNVLKLARIIGKKGYSKHESLDMAIKIFDEMELERQAGFNVGWTAEMKANLIIDKN